MTIQTIDTLIGPIGDAHGNTFFAERAINVLASRGVRQHHFLGDFGFILTGTSQEDQKLKRVRLALERADAQAFVTGGNSCNGTAVGLVDTTTCPIAWLPFSV